MMVKMEHVFLKRNAKHLMEAEMGMYPMDVVAEALQMLVAGWGSEGPSLSSLLMRP